MRHSAGFLRALMAIACVPVFLVLPARAAINAYGLGASYDSTQSNVIFRVYSSRATRIEVDLYMTSMGATEVQRIPLTANSTTNTAASRARRCPRPATKTIRGGHFATHPRCHPQPCHCLRRSVRSVDLRQGRTRPRRRSQAPVRGRLPLRS
jgi:hypothetical protein